MNPGTFAGVVPSMTSVTTPGQIQFFQTSTTWITPLDANFVIYAIGPGGSGGLVSGSMYTTTSSGGGAGGLAIKRMYIPKNTSIYITIGAGGGGTTRVNGGGLNIVANGGSNGSAGGFNGTFVTAGGAGGSATGGDVNWTGGKGGTATVNGSSYSDAYGWARSGGGAVAWYGVGYAGGDATTTCTSGFFTGPSAAGGAGIGGKGGDATQTQNGFGTCVASGGSTVSAGVSITNVDGGVAAAPTPTLSTAWTSQPYNILVPAGNVAVPASVGASAVSGAGCGSSGSSAGANTSGFLAGTGGYGGTTGYGGGGGGGITGGQGCVIICWAQ